MAAQVLVYYRTAGYYHESIPTALTVLGNLSSSYKPTFSNDPAIFNSSLSDTYAAVCFLSNSDEILDTPQQKYNLFDFLSNGGGLIGIHSASAALFSTPFFGTAMGAFFDYHPTIQEASFYPVNSSFPGMSAVPQSWRFQEEVYNFRSDPRDTNATVILGVNEASYSDPYLNKTGYYQGFPHPVAWYRDSRYDLGNGTNTNGMNATNGTTVQDGTFYATGRVFYTALGHTDETWMDKTFQAHIKGGIEWVLSPSTNSTPSATTSASSIETSSTRPTETPSSAFKMKTPMQAVLLASLTLLVWIS